MKIVNNIKYSRDHEWAKIDGNRAYIGITDYAQHTLGEVVFVELPEVGAILDKGDVIGVVESVKAASDVYTPISGKIVEINEELLDNPEKINEKPFESWIAVLEMNNASQLNDLMTETEYENFCTREE